VTGEFGFECVIDFIGNAIQVIFGLTGGIFLIMLLVGAYKYAIGVATGDSAGGKNTIKFALAGFLVSLLSFYIIDFFVAALTP